MDRKSFSSVLDEAVSQLDGQVRALKNQQATLVINIKDLEYRRDKLSEEIKDLEIKHSYAIKEHKNEVDSMLASAQEKLSNANQKNAEATSKSSLLDEKLKEADNLIKSNKGLQDSLTIQNKLLKEKVSKIEDLFNKIKEV